MPSSLIDVGWRHDNEIRRSTVWGQILVRFVHLVARYIYLGDTLCSGACVVLLSPHFFIDTGIDKVDTLVAVFDLGHCLQKD